MMNNKDACVEDVAIASARVLLKYGINTPDYTEWKTLKDDLLKLHPHLSDYAQTIVGRACSEFNNHG